MEKFTPQNSAILLVDHQDMTVSWIYSQPQKTVVNNVRMLGRIGNDMKVPLIVTSTMEDNIGTNIKDIQQVAPEAYKNRVKRGGTLNCFLDENFNAAIKKTGRKNLIIAGLTTDICLFHTAVGAIKEGYKVQIVADACGSMSALADEVTFDRLRGLGASVAAANSTMTELFTDFGTADGQKVMQINMEEVISKLGK
jgi:nicotinamidase-related amidase